MRVRHSPALRNLALDEEGARGERRGGVLGAVEASNLRDLGSRDAELGREERLPREALSRLPEI
jgi:hypothetical protein